MAEKTPREEMSIDQALDLVNELKRLAIKGEQAYTRVRLRDGIEEGPFIQADTQNDVVVIPLILKKESKSK